MIQRKSNERGGPEDGAVQVHPGRPGFSSLSTFSTPAVTSSVLPPGLFLHDQQDARPVVDDGVANRGGMTDADFGNVTSRMGAPLRNSTTVRARSSGVVMRPSCATLNRRFGVSMNPPALSTAASPVARVTASSVTPAARKTLRVHEHLELFVTLSPDGDVGDAFDRHEPRSDGPERGLAQLHLRERFRGETIFNTRLSDEYGAMSTGGFTTAGSRFLRQIQPLLHQLARVEDVRPCVQRSS